METMVQAVVRDNDVLQRYEIVADEELRGHVDYQRLGDELVIVHTSVFPGAEGLGMPANSSHPSWMTLVVVRALPLWSYARL
jgi:hypothetical protein